MPNGAKPKVVIIGAGAAGVFTAYFLEKNAPGHFDITILEENDRIGGHTRSEERVVNGQQFRIDAGAQFFSESSQPDYYALLEEEGFFADPDLITETDVGVTLWNVTQDEPLFRVPETLFELIVIKVFTDYIRWLNFSILTTAAIVLYETADSWEQTFGDWLDGIPFLFPNPQEEDAFKADVARPLLYQFGLIDPDRLDELSAKFVIYYFVGSLPWEGLGEGPFRVNNIKIGLDGVLKKLLDKSNLTAGTQTGTKVESITRQPDDSWVVTPAVGDPLPADEVVFAINPPRILQVLPEEEDLAALREVLSGMEYVNVPVRIQSPDASHMPTSTSEWSVSNVLVVEDGGGNPANYMLSVWFGPLRQQPAAAKYFKSWGSPNLVPQSAPEETVQHHELMVGTPEFIKQRQLLRAEHQGQHHLCFVGGYSIDYDSQNACLKSARQVATKLLQDYVPEALTAEDSFFAYVRPQDAGVEREVADFEPDPRFEGRPALLDAIEGRVVEVAREDPVVQRWLETQGDRRRWQRPVR